MGDCQIHARDRRDASGTWALRAAQPVPCTGCSHARPVLCWKVFHVDPTVTTVLLDLDLSFAVTQMRTNACHGRRVAHIHPST